MRRHRQISVVGVLSVGIAGCRVSLPRASFRLPGDLHGQSAVPYVPNPGQWGLLKAPADDPAGSPLRSCRHPSVNAGRESGREIPLYMHVEPIQWVNGGGPLASREAAGDPSAGLIPPGRESPGCSLPVHQSTPGQPDRPWYGSGPCRAIELPARMRSKSLCAGAMLRSGNERLY